MYRQTVSHEDLVTHFEPLQFTIQGVDVKAPWKGSPDATNTISGITLPHSTSSVHHCSIDCHGLVFQARQWPLHMW